MASPTATEFKELFPQFASLSDTAVERWLDQAPLRFKASKFHAQWHMAAYLYTAHQLVMFNPAASADNSADHESRGPIMAEKVGDLSRSYGSTIDMASVPKSLLWLTSTTYGQQLIGLILSRSAARGRVVRTGSSYAGLDTTTNK